MLCVIMLNVVMLHVINNPFMLSVIMLSVAASSRGVICDRNIFITKATGLHQMNQGTLTKREGSVQLTSSLGKVFLQKKKNIVSV